jgi:hypothetical protein
MPPVNWDQFRDGDRIRVTFEGVWRTSDTQGGEYRYLATGGRNMHIRDALYPATSAELIERPFQPPAAGKLFRAGMGQLCISLGDHFRIVRTNGGNVPGWPGLGYPFQKETHEWRDSIEVLDI